MRRLSGWNETHLSDIEHLGQFFGQPQMAEVNRVEGAA
jgi:hypothetical protein